MAKLKHAGKYLLLTSALVLVVIGVLVNFGGASEAAGNSNIGISNIVVNNVSPFKKISGNTYGSGTDAIAIRIVSNPNHLNIDRWYASQNFQGSPQKLSVDGYEAIRDNRTVYVAATNVVNQPNLPGGQAAPAIVYFNIYIITYNAGASQNTIDIFGKILSNWRFNNNIPELIPGTCSLPVKICASNDDCAASQTCDLTTKNCLSQNNCRLDGDCPAASFCTSQKAKLQRDIKRLNTLTDINSALSAYRSLHQRYPNLLSGTYLPQVAVSTWPSWQSVFLSTLGLAAAKDPVNRLGVCNSQSNATSSILGFEDQSCFNPATKKFYLNGGAANLILPANSSALVYTTDENGANYNLCSRMETNYQIATFSGAPLNLSQNNCQTTAPVGFSGGGNNPPTITAFNLNGTAGQEFNGFVAAVDPENNPLIFSVDTTLGDWSSWSGAPVVKATNDAKQKKIWSVLAGAPGDYPITIQVADNQGATVSTTTNIHIESGAPQINGGDIDYYLSGLSGNQLNYNLYFTDPNFSSLDLSYSIALAKNKNSNQWLTLFKAKEALATSGLIQKNLGGILIPPVPIPSPIPAPQNQNQGLKKQGGVIVLPVPGLSGGQVLAGTCNVAGDGLNTHWIIPAANLNCWFNLNNGLKGQVTKVSEDGYRLTIYGTLNNLNLSADTIWNYRLLVKNSLNKQNVKNFKITLRRNPPSLDYNCGKIAGLYDNYSCQINNLNAGNKTTTYTFTGLPTGLSGSGQGLISGQALAVGTYQVQVQAQNEYQAAASSSFSLEVKNNCGNNLVYYPGGPWNANGEIRNQGGYYRTVLVGNQCWLADNLNVSSALNANCSNPNFGAYFNVGSCYNNDDTYCQADGRLYTIAEATTDPCDTGEATRGLCPSGWHLPTDGEWQTLEAGLTAGAGTCDPARSNAWGCDQAGTKLKTFGGSDFNALLVGRIANNLSVNRNANGYFWTSSKIGNQSLYRQLDNTHDQTYRGVPPGFLSVPTKYSLRCIKDRVCVPTCAAGQHCLKSGICVPN